MVTFTGGFAYFDNPPPKYPVHNEQGAVVGSVLGIASRLTECNTYVGNGIDVDVTEGSLNDIILCLDVNDDLLKDAGSSFNVYDFAIAVDECIQTVRGVLIITILG